MGTRIRKIRSEGLTKRQLRSKMIKRLKSQKEEYRAFKSRLVGQQLNRLKQYRDAKTVMFYIAMKGEVETREMIENAKLKGKIIAVPVIAKNRSSLRPAILDSHAHLKMGPYGVPEPVLSRFVSLKSLDLIVAPGLAFDARGNRLGRGKGYYDRFLKQIPKDTPAIGLAFKSQILPQVPTTPLDVRVKKVLFA